MNEFIASGTLGQEPAIVKSSGALDGQAAVSQVWHSGVLAGLAWILFGLLTGVMPNHIVGFNDWLYTKELGIAGVLIGTGLLLVSPSWVQQSGGPRLQALRSAGPWLFATPIILGLWEYLTAKTGILPVPFFAPPQSLIDVYIDDWQRLGSSVVNTLKLLAMGVAYGAVVGFLVGVSVGWSKNIGYWVHPVLRVLGPLPATALLPLTFYFFPSSYSAAIFLVALATGFPVAVLTWSGIASVSKSYYDVARTLGASEWFLVFRVAIPAALPQVFVGLFMGLSASFSVLVTAEMMGVKSGLGWYLTWAQGWASYTNMYAALIVMALLFSGLISLLFLVRDYVLSWQKGTVKW
ncbi:ABC transporter permease [Advenella sp. RU8]|uniref:ABC transporter permease n=1 Tax=Advenella sp. RU8 TaxID=3399575 RepID=UPI003AAAA409